MKLTTIGLLLVGALTLGEESGVQAVSLSESAETFNYLESMHKKKKHDKKKKKKHHKHHKKGKKDKKEKKEEDDDEDEKEDVETKEDNVNAAEKA